MATQNTADKVKSLRPWKNDLLLNEIFLFPAEALAD